MENPVDKVDNSSPDGQLTLSGPVIGLFAKQPLPGRVKTRLTPPLTPQEACDLYAVALEESVRRLSGAFPVVLCHAGDRNWFASRFPGRPLLAQTEGGLGERLAAASAQLFAAGGGPVLLAGADSPDLPTALVSQAVQLLAAADAVTIPCTDGGYALLGLRRPEPGLFAGIPWSTSGVLAATRRQAACCRLDYRELAAWDDLDDLPALRRLLARSPDSATARHAVTVLSHRL